MYIIAGDSWGCGEWMLTNESYSVSHGGLSQYLRDDGHKVINLSRGGNSNWANYELLDVWLQNCLISHIQNIFIFQTEWFRDHELRTPWTPKNYGYAIDAYDVNTASITISKWLYALSAIATRYNVKIGIIGGCSDTIWLDKFEMEYPGLYIACQSLTNLCVNDDHRVGTPVTGLHNSVSIAVCKKQAVNQDALNKLLNEIDLGEARHEVWKQNLELFYPDGYHANRIAHRKLYDFLIEMQLIKK